MTMPERQRYVSSNDLRNRERERESDEREGERES